MPVSSRVLATWSLYLAVCVFTRRTYPWPPGCGGRRLLADFREFVQLVYEYEYVHLGATSTGRPAPRSVDEVRHQFSHLFVSASALPASARPPRRGRDRRSYLQTWRAP